MQFHTLKGANAMLQDMLAAAEQAIGPASKLAELKITFHVGKLPCLHASLLINHSPYAHQCNSANFTSVF